MKLQKCFLQENGSQLHLIIYLLYYSGNALFIIILEKQKNNRFFHWYNLIWCVSEYVCVCVCHSRDVVGCGQCLCCDCASLQMLRQN